MPAATTVMVSKGCAVSAACAVRKAATAATAMIHVALMAVTLENCLLDGIRSRNHIGCTAVPGRTLASPAI
jgi:hypothetical protein